MSAAPLLVVFGSARADGDTGRAVAALRRALGVASDLVDLAGIDLGAFDYSRPAQHDGFDAVVARMVAARAILFATPVYWYAMSGRMKTLFDRFSDLLGDRDPERRARRLAGRDMWMLAVGADAEPPPGFDAPFRMTADYLGMVWRGSFYVAARDGERARRLAVFAADIAASLR